MKSIECPFCKINYKPVKRVVGNYLGSSTHFMYHTELSEKQCPVCWKETPTGQRKKLCQKS